MYTIRIKRGVVCSVLISNYKPPNQNVWLNNIQLCDVFLRGQTTYIFGFRAVKPYLNNLAHILGHFTNKKSQKNGLYLNEFLILL